MISYTLAPTKNNSPGWWKKRVKTKEAFVSEIKNTLLGIEVGKE